jgi:retron-type reverse transcriptase
LKVSRNFGEKRLTGALFLDVAKTFDTVWIDGLAYKLIALKFPSYMVKTIQPFLRSWTFVASFQAATSSRRGMRAGVPQGGLISPVLFSLYVNDIPVPSRHVELALYADDTAVIATSRKPALLLSYLELYLADLELWLRKWRTPSTCRRAWRCSSHAGKSNPLGQLLSSGSQTCGLIQPVIWG